LLTVCGASDDKAAAMAAILERRAQKLELLLHPAGAGASGQASITDSRGASDVRKWTIASIEIQASRPGAESAPWGSCVGAAPPGSRGRRRRGEPERRVAYTVFSYGCSRAVDVAGLEPSETVNHFSVAANVRSIRSTFRSSARSSPVHEGVMFVAARSFFLA
jgi:hypothetical protein